MFSKDVKACAPAPAEKGTAETKPDEPIPDEIAAFYASLSPNQKKVHDIAKVFLSASYTVRTSNGFKQWLAAQKTSV